jgi:ketosteroid isomerase-like protein
MNVKKFAEEWIAAWNSHDIDRILSHYSDDFEITTPMIKVAMGLELGTLKGKGNVKKYWEQAFKKVPDLRFNLKDAAEGVGSIAIYYESVFGKMAIEVMFFNNEGKVNKAIAHYA